MPCSTNASVAGLNGHDYLIIRVVINCAAPYIVCVSQLLM